MNGGQPLQVLLGRDDVTSRFIAPQYFILRGAPFSVSRKRGLPHDQTQG